MATTTTTHKPDRITRAVAIIARVGSIARYDDDRWGVQSAPGHPVYTVEGNRCSCPDFRKTHAPCKHLWATVGRNAAMLIVKLRRCQSLADLRETGELYAPALAGVPAGFVQTARAEYRRAVNRIVTRITFADASEGRMAA